MKYDFSINGSTPSIEFKNGMYYTSFTLGGKDFLFKSEQPFSQDEMISKMSSLNNNLSKSGSYYKSPTYW